jgi:2-dehydropantoate 2-reductase
MQLLIVGAGAIGGTIGAHMIRAGHDILLCDADPAHVEAINRDGLTIEGPVENFTVKATAITPDQLPEVIEHAAVAVKSHHTKQAAELLRSRIAPDGWVVSFQNGLTADILAEAVGTERVIVSFVNFGADVMGPGRIMQGNIGTFRVGEPDKAEITPRVRQLVAALPYAEATDNVMGFLWGKEAYGAMLYAGAVSDLSIADSLEDPRWRPLMLAVAREVLAQSPVEPQSFDGFDPSDLEGSLARLVTFNRNSAKSHSGIYRDLMVRKRKTEVDDLLRDLAGPLTTYAGEIIHAIEGGERTCEVANLELLAAYERTERLGKPLRAVVRTLQAPKRLPDGPLHGVPIAVKDIIDIAGVPRGNGNPEAMASAPAVADAPVITALRQAAADVFATTSLLEYAAGATHPEVPEALNPFDLGRTAGGSSGGSAALVGVGACEVALGTDTGGSIRLPAHYCATVGFKPSYGAIDLTGVEPLSPSLDHVGLLARDIATATRVFAAITGTSATEAADADTVSARLRIGVVIDQFDDPVLEPEILASLRSAVETLGGHADTVDVDGQAFEEIRSTFDDILLFEAWLAHRQRVEESPSHYGPETLRLFQSASKVTREAYETGLRRRAELLPATNAIYEGVDVLLSPAAPFVAPATTPPVDTPEGAAEGRFTSVYNLTGAPALVLPCGWSQGGLPVGLQLSTLPGTDFALLAAAAEIERLLAVERRSPAIA